MRILWVCALVGSALPGGAGLGNAGAETAARQVVFENSGSDERRLDVTSYAGGTISNLGSGRTTCLDVSSYVDYSPALIFP
ncbi:hypothetical protein ACQPYE_16600 [Actinosynnema sp. CA-299493]